MENESPNAQTLFRDLVETSVTEARQDGDGVHSHHEAYALLAERLDNYWKSVRNRCAGEVLLDHLVELAAQCAMAADDLVVDEVLADQKEVQ
jgi:hypothetical protein